MKLEAIFQSKMIFQREKPIRIFGTGEGTANATLCGVSASSVRTEKGWLITLPPMPAGGPYTLFLDLNGERKELNDVLIGEVFLASGQSNMEMPLFRTEGGFDEAGLAKDDEIRLYTVPRRLVDGQPNWNRHFESLYSTDTEWQKCTEDSALHFSAIGYYFAKEMRAALGVPVGIVSCNWGGTRVESWLPEETVRTYPDIDYDTECCKKEQTWWHYSNVTIMYNGMYYPIRNYTVKGFIWYQGESNVGKHDTYPDRFKTLVNLWRENQGCESPVYLVELAPWLYGGDGT